MAICEWAEMRTKNLDGLAELLDDSHSTFFHLNKWLNERKKVFFNFLDLKNKILFFKYK